MSNNYFLKNMVERLSRGDFTYFLTQIEARTLSKILNKKGISYHSYKPYPNAEKVIFWNKKKPSVFVYEIVSSGVLTHASILKTFYIHSIKKEMYGDILIGNRVYVLLLAEVKDYVLTHVKEIGYQTVNFKKAKFSSIESFLPSFSFTIIQTSSNRLDTILSKLLHISRNRICEKIASKEVMLNENIVIKGTVHLHKGDIFSIRGYGKYVYEQENQKRANTITIKRYK